MSALDTIVALFVLGMLGLIIYLKMTKKTITEFIRDIREASRDEEVPQNPLS